MVRFWRALGRGLIVLFILFAASWLLAPEERVDREIAFDASVIGADVESWLDQRELQFSNIRSQTAKRIVWAGEPGVKTRLAVIYLHGFSASAEEIRPVPDMVAAGLGANLFFTRLTGHGLPGDAMAEASAGDWIEDMAEAMAIGRRLGERVLILSTSTGGTLAALGAADPALSQGMAGVVMVSPNFGIRSPAARIHDLPFARHWGPVVAGQTRSFSPQNAAHGLYWTTSYPTVALFPMAALVRHVVALDLSGARAPLLVLYPQQDQVVDPAKTESVLRGWGGPRQMERRVMGLGDDPYAHVIAGDILSPGQTADTVRIILDWARGQGL